MRPARTAEPDGVSPRRRGSRAPLESEHEVVGQPGEREDPIPARLDRGEATDQARSRVLEVLEIGRREDAADSGQADGPKGRAQTRVSGSRGVGYHTRDGPVAGDPNRKLPGAAGGTPWPACRGAGATRSPTGRSDPSRTISTRHRAPRAPASAVGDRATLGTQLSAPKLDRTPSNGPPRSPAPPSSSRSSCRVATSCCDPRGRRLAAGRFEHGLGRVGCQHPDAAAGEPDRVLAGAASELEEPLSRLDEVGQCSPHRRPIPTAEAAGGEFSIVGGGGRVKRLIGRCTFHDLSVSAG